MFDETIFEFLNCRNDKILGSLKLRDRYSGKDDIVKKALYVSYGPAVHLCTRSFKYMVHNTVLFFSSEGRMHISRTFVSSANSQYKILVRILNVNRPTAVKIREK